MNTLDVAVGGTTEMASVLIKAEATETRTLLNIRDLETAFVDEMRRSPAAAGTIQGSYELLVRDWTDDSGVSDDKYDPELAALFRETSAGVELDAKLMQEFLDRLEEKDPTFGHLVVNNPKGIDAIRRASLCWHSSRWGRSCSSSSQCWEPWLCWAYLTQSSRPLSRPSRLGSGLTTPSI